MNCTDYTIRKITVSELPRLTELFNYNDIDSMISENTKPYPKRFGRYFYFA